MYLPKADTLQQYTLTCNSKDNAPKSIAIYGSADGKTYEKIDERQNQSFRRDLSINFYAVSNTKEYSYYRLDIENADVQNIGLCELQLICGQKDEAEDQVLYGDVDGNQKIDATDALYVLQNCVGIRELDERATKAADVNNDGRIDTTDALNILQKAVGILDMFEAEE